MSTYTFGLYKQLPPGASQHEIDRAESSVQGNARGVEDYWKIISKFRWSVTAEGFVMLGTASPYAPHYGRQDVIKHNHDNCIDGFDKYNVIGGSHPEYCGQGQLNGIWSATYPSSQCGVKTTIHELGHTLGLHHASTLRGDIRQEYGDQTDIMGNGAPIVGLNSPHLVQLGIQTEREVYNVVGNEQVLIAPVELLEQALHDHEYCSVIASGGYHISLRKAQMRYSAGGANRRPQTLYVHSTDRGGYSVRHLLDMQPGDTKTLPNGVVVEYLEYHNECARVNVITDPKSKIKADVWIPNELPPAPKGATVTEAHSGNWYNPITNGQGLQVMIEGDRALVYWFTFNLYNASRRFYYGIGDIADGQARIKLNTTTGGTWADPKKHEIVDAGNATLHFTAPDRGVFNYNTPENGRGTLLIEPVALSDGRQGSFYQESRKGEGITVDFYTRGDKELCSAKWYSYGPKDRKVHGGITDQRWYSCEGEMGADGSYDLTIYEVEGGYFGLPDRTQLVAVGYARLHIDGNEMIFGYEIFSPTVTGKGVYELGRVFS